MTPYYSSRPMQFDLIDILRATKSELVRQLESTADRKGELCWLFLPEETRHRVALVAHIDTVHDDTVNKTIELIKDGEELCSPDGLGADDRAGVWAGLDAFHTIPEPYRPVLLLTDEEECGGRGAIEAASLFRELLADISFFLELDRRGNMQCVFYNGEPEEFRRYIEGFGFTREHGSFSDIVHLCPAANRCGANLSIGYKNAHSKEERLIRSYMQNTVERLPLILKDNYKRQKAWKLR